MPSEQGSVAPELQPAEEREPDPKPIDPRAAWVGWAMPNAESSGAPGGDGDEGESRGLRVAPTVVGAALGVAGAVGLVVGTVMFNGIDRELRCGSAYCASRTDDTPVPYIVLGVSGASLLAGLVLLPIGVIPALSAEKKPTEAGAAAAAYAPELALTPGGVMATWRYQ